MRRQDHVRMAILVIGALAMLAVMAQGVLARSPLPAATAQSPEEAQLKQLPPAARHVARPSKAELLTRCQQRAACRATLDAAKKGQQFTTLPVPVSVYLTPQDLVVSSPYSWLAIGAANYNPPGRFSFYASMGEGTKTMKGGSEYRPYVYIYFTAPAAGWYIIDVRAGSAPLKLRHGSGPTIETWDFGSVPCAAGICDYATMEYLQKGAHGFYFYPNSSVYSFDFHSVSIESHP